MSLALTAGSTVACPPAFLPAIRLPSPSPLPPPGVSPPELAQDHPPAVGALHPPSSPDCMGDHGDALLPLQHLPAEVRPREKLLARGPAALADAELLAILLRTGLPGRSVVVFAQEVLDHFGGLAGLLRADPQALGEVHGVGPAKGAALSAVLEIARRALRQPLTESPVFDHVDTVRDYLALQLGGLSNECFAVMFLDTRHRLIRLEILSQGTLSHTIAYPREVVKRALALNAGAVILSHNHPSGCPEPSPQDIEMTRTMTQALALVEVRLLDHFIVGAGRVVSMAELGCL